MKADKKTLFIVSIIILFVIGIIFYGSSEREIIKIGVILPLTGEGTPDQGQASEMAITLAVEEINSNGGVNGKKIFPIFEDSQCDSVKGVTAINKLINIDNVDIIIGDICDGVTASIIPIAEENNRVLITPGSTSPDISNGGDYIFRFWFSENDLGGMVANSAMDMKLLNISIIYIDNAWGVAQKNAVKKKLLELGGNVVSEQAINPESNDFRTPILKSESESPQAYYIGVHPNGLVNLLKTLKEQGIKKTVFSHGGLVGSTQTLGLGEDLLEGIIAPFVYTNNSEFRDKFVKRFGREPGITADSSYDIVKVIEKIMRDTGKTDAETVKKGLYNIKDYRGASGKITVDSNGDTHRELQLMIVRDGKLVPL